MIVDNRDGMEEPCQQPSPHNNMMNTHCKYYYLLFFLFSVAGLEVQLTFSRIGGETLLLRRGSSLSNIFFMYAIKKYS